jgi:hypothetical protein
VLEERGQERLRVASLRLDPRTRGAQKSALHLASANQSMNALRVVFILALAFATFACRDKVDVEKVVAGEGYLLLDPEGRKLRVAVKEMEIYLIDPAYQDKISGDFRNLRS